MTKLMNTAGEALSKVVLFLVGCVMAGIGLAFVMMLAMFGFAVAGLALLAAPFLRMAVPADDTAMPNAA